MFADTANNNISANIPLSNKYLFKNAAYLRAISCDP